MAFSPEQLKSGRYRGAFRHPVTRKIVRQTFDYSYEAEAWAITEEQRAREAAAGVAGSVARIEAAVAREPRWLGPTVREYGDAYLRRRAGFLAAETRKNYAGHLRQLAKPAGDVAPLADRPMGTLSYTDVEEYVTACVEAEHGRYAINGRLGLLRTLYRDLLARGQWNGEEVPIQRDPMFGIKDLPVEVDVDRVLSVAEEGRLLLAAGPELRAAMLAGLDAGLRWQEVYGMRAASVVRNVIVVTHVVEKSGKVRAYPKGHRLRKVPMTARLAEALAPFVDAAPSGDALLFPSPGRADRDDADPYRPWIYRNHLRRLWGPAMFTAGLATETWTPTTRVRKYGPDKGKPVMQRRIAPEFGFHALRHTYGTRMGWAGIPRREIAELMGHADEATTMRYMHTEDEGRMHARAVAALEATVAKEREEAVRILAALERAS